MVFVKNCKFDDFCNKDRRSCTNCVHYAVRSYYEEAMKKLNESLLLVDKLEDEGLDKASLGVIKEIAKTTFVLKILNYNYCKCKKQKVD